MPQGLTGEPALMRQWVPEFQVIDLAGHIYAREYILSARLEGRVTVASGAHHGRAHAYADDGDSCRSNAGLGPGLHDHPSG